MADLTAALTRERARTNVAAIVLVLVALGCIGIALRFVGYSSRLFWTDEAITALRVSGHTDGQLTAVLLDGRPHSSAEIRAFIGKPNAPLSAVVASLAKEDAQHPPAYYVFAALWTRAFGFSLASLRMFSVLVGCAVPFAVGWLCFELYGKRLSAAVGFALAALSPVLVIYSQQAREYELWALLVALSTAALLRAARARRLGWWLLYTLFASAGLYTDTLFAALLLSHFVYAALELRAKRRIAAIASIVAAAAAFIPWAIVIVGHARGIQAENSWTATPWPLRMLVIKWLFNAGTTFFDLEFARAAFAIALVGVFAVVAAALFWNLGAGSIRKRRLIGAIFAVQIALFVPDLVLHQHRSTVTRYGMALWIVLLVAVAGYLGRQLRLRYRPQPWYAVTALLLLLSLWSSASDVRARVWWDNRGDAQNLPIAASVNAAPSPLLVVAGSWARVLALSLYLRPGVSVQMQRSNAVDPPAHGFAAAFLLGKPQDALSYEARGARLRTVYVSRESNAQVRTFRGTDNGREYLSLWRFENYAGMPP